MKNKLELLVQPADLRQPPCSRPPPCGLLSEAKLTAVKLNKLRSKSEFTIQVTTVLSCPPVCPAAWKICPNLITVRKLINSPFFGFITA